MKPEIINIAPKYNTDKNDHGYIEYYAKHLPETANKILEVGVLAGNSIRMLHELYPEAHIFGLDLFIENPIPFQADWVTWFQGSQIDGKLLKEIRGHGQFDICIEDGSHNSIDQWITFWGLMGSCDLYVLEDAHCAKEEFYRQGIKYEATMLGHLTLSKTPLFPSKNYLYNDQIAFIYP